MALLIMEKLYLEIKCFLIYWLIRLKIRPNVWHKCEIDLGEIKAVRLAQFFRDHNQKIHLTKESK